VDNPSNSRADAAYDRALAAFQEKSYDVARRWAVEALAHNRQHSGARTLMGRLDAVRAVGSPFQGPTPGSEVISTDPTILISRASGSQSISDAIEPTVMVRRDEMGRRPSDTDPRVAFPPSPPRSSGRSTSEPTMIAQSRAKSTPSSRTKSSFSVGGALQSLGERLQRGNDRHQRTSSTRRGSSTGSGLSSPVARGAALAVGMVVLGGLLVWGLFLLGRWIWPAGQALTITPPTGGTIKAEGIECGSSGTRCSARFAKGETVELVPVPDAGYLLTAYTGSCAPTGRVSMTEPRTCGAIFGVDQKPAKPLTFRLTINKPEGGTIVVAGGILCGTKGSTCSTDIPSDAPVTLMPEADEGYVWQQFNGDCPGTGTMNMNSAKTCGAVFTKTVGPAVNRGDDSSPSPGPPKRKERTSAPTPLPVPPPPPPSSQANTSGPQTAPPPMGPVTPTGPTTPPPPPKSADDHAKEEIKTLANKYCAALASTKAEQVRSLFHNDNERDLKTWFKEVKSLQCTVTSPPDYDRLDSGDFGTAQVKFGMKMVVKMSTSGAPETRDLIVTMVVSRKSYQSPFLIDRVQTDPKPK
jgi:hypothetical protein